MVFCDVWRQWGGGKIPPGISRVLEHIATKFQRLYTYVFGVTLSSGGTSDFMGRPCAPDIQDGGQLTGSSNIYETMTHIIKNSNGEPTAFDRGKLAGSVPRRFQ